MRQSCVTSIISRCGTNLYQTSLSSRLYYQRFHHLSKSTATCVQCHSLNEEICLPSRRVYWPQAKDSQQAMPLFIFYKLSMRLMIAEIPVWIFFSNFSKGFDMTDHHILVDELSLLGVDPVLSNFWLIDTQAVCIDNTLSECKHTHSGIPQGSKMSITLFSIMINRLLRE